MDLKKSNGLCTKFVHKHLRSFRKRGQPDEERNGLALCQVSSCLRHPIVRHLPAFLDPHVIHSHPPSTASLTQHASSNHTDHSNTN
jgi:hypothetical protein